MRVSYFFILLLLLVPFTSAVESATGGDGSGEGFFDKTAYAFCTIYPKLCGVEVVDSSSYGVDEDLKNRYDAGSEANQPLSEQEILKKRIDNAKERTTTMYSILSSFWSLTTTLFKALFVFIELYVVFWGLFVLIPKLLNLLIKKIIERDKKNV